MHCRQKQRNQARSDAKNAREENQFLENPRDPQGWPSVSVFCRPDIGFLSVSGIGRYRVKIFGKIPDSCLISAQTYDVIKDEIKIGKTNYISSNF